MWPKSITAFFGGLILSVSMMLSLYQLLPLATDIKLLIGLIIGFLIWVGAMVFYYSYNSAKASSIACIKLILLSVAANVFLFLAK